MTKIPVNKMIYQASARAHPNIALIKYWGNSDSSLRIPSNGSISMNLGDFYTETSIHFDRSLPADTLIINDQKVDGEALKRVKSFLDILRTMTGIHCYASIESRQNFPQSAGLASSASAFAALALAASTALGMQMTEKELSILARKGSGSACRSIPAGFVEWHPGDTDNNSYASSIAPAEHWSLTDCVAIITEKAKTTGSTDGHQVAHTSLLQNARLDDASRRLSICRQAILERDFEKLASITELDSNLMHAVMMTSQPALFYWEPTSLRIMKNVIDWRNSGLAVFYTIDAGPNVHVITETDSASRVKSYLEEIPGVRYVLCSCPGQGAVV